MSATEGFWPGEAPAPEEEDDVQEPQAAEPVGWPQPSQEEPESSDAELEPAAMAVAEAEPQPEAEPEAEPEVEQPETPAAQHIPGELDIPDDVAVLEGSPSGADRTVGGGVARFNGEISNRLLESALEALAAAGVPDERITVMPVPGAFELPIGAMALPETPRYRGRARRDAPPLPVRDPPGLRRPGGNGPLRLRRRRGGVRPAARGARDGRPGGVRRAHRGLHRAGGGADRQGRGRRARRPRDGRPVLASAGTSQVRVAAILVRDVEGLRDLR